MKTTFKKVFEKFDDELMNIEATNISQNVDIDIEKITGNVLMRVNNNDKKKKISKKLITFLVAAVIIVTGAIGVVATESINSIFSGFFHTKSDLNELGLYDGGNVVVSSPDDNLNIKLLGVTGDGEKMYSAIEITKKDGSEVIDKAYNYKDRDDADSITAVCKEKNSNEKARVSSQCRYELCDGNKVLKLYVYSIITEGDMQGGRITINSSDIIAYKVDNVLASLELPKGIMGVNPEELRFGEVELEAKRNELGLTEDECMYINHNGKREYCQATYKRFDLPFEISYDINFDTDDFIQEELSANDVPNLVESFTKSPRVSVTPFGVYLYGECSTKDVDSSKWSKCFKDIGWDDTSQIIMNDGTIYYLYPFEGGADTTDEDTETYIETLPLNFSPVVGPQLYPDINVIDVREVKTVMINGDIVYSK